MTDVATAPLTAEVLKELFDKTDFIRIPATEAEFWNLIVLPEYRIEFHHHQIVGTMSYAATNHERVVSNLIFDFRSLLEEDLYEVFGSNRPVYAEAPGNTYEPDVHVAGSPLVEYKYKKNKTATQNPKVIVEVFSPSTKGFDLGDKLDCYKTIESLQHIIFIEPNRIHVQVFNRSKRPNEWQNVDYFDLEQKIRVLGKSIWVKNIYKKVVFGI